MKGRKARRRTTSALDALTDGFVKGFASTVLLAGASGRRAEPRLLVSAALSGTALAAASLAASSIIDRRPATALAALAAGAAVLRLFPTAAAASDGSTHQPATIRGASPAPK